MDGKLVTTTQQLIYLIRKSIIDRCRENIDFVWVTLYGARCNKPRGAYRARRTKGLGLSTRRRSGGVQQRVRAVGTATCFTLLQKYDRILIGSTQFQTQLKSYTTCVAEYGYNFTLSGSKHGHVWLKLWKREVFFGVELMKREKKQIKVKSLAHTFQSYMTLLLLTYLILWWFIMFTYIKHIIKLV